MTNLPKRYYLRFLLLYISYFETSFFIKVFWYLTAGRDRRFLLPDVIKLLEVGDSTTTSKKPRDVKLDQLQADAVPQLMEWFSENMEKCVNDSTLCPLMVAVMSHSDHIMKGDENSLITAQAALAKKVNQKSKISNLQKYFRLRQASIQTKSTP